MRVCLIVLLLTACLSAEYLPVDFNRWEDEGSGKLTLGGSIHNYLSATGWQTIKNKFVLYANDSAVCKTGFLKTTVYPDGRSRISVNWQQKKIDFTTRLRAVGFFKQSTQQRQYVWHGSMGLPSVENNEVEWQFTGLRHRIEKHNGRVAHVVEFLPVFLDSAVTLYNQRPDSLDIALASIMQVVVSGFSEDSLTGGSEYRKRFCRWGRRTLGLTQQKLKFPRSEEKQAIRLRQHWKREGDTLWFVEWVPMSQVKQIHLAYPDSTIWHYASVELTTDDLLRDTYINQSYMAYAYSVQEYIIFGNYWNILNNHWRSGHMRWDYSDYTDLGLGSGDLDSAIFDGYCSAFLDDGDAMDSTMWVFPSVVAWHCRKETDVSCPTDSVSSNYNKRACKDAAGPCGCDVIDTAWNTLGCRGRDTDYLGDDSAEIFIDGTGFVHWDLTTPTIYLLDADTNHGYIFMTNEPATADHYLNVTIRDGDEDFEAWQPTLTMYYQAPGLKQYRRLRMLRRQ